MHEDKNYNILPQLSYIAPQRALLYDFTLSNVRRIYLVKGRSILANPISIALVYNISNIQYLESRLRF